LASSLATGTTATGLARQLVAFLAAEAEGLNMTATGKTEGIEAARSCGSTHLMATGTVGAWSQRQRVLWSRQVSGGEMVAAETGGVGAKPAVG
jgi:hypothetical protein